MQQYLELGEIVSVQGIKGEVRINPWCDDPHFILEFDTVYLGKEKVPTNILKGHIAKNVAVLSIENITTVEQAQKLRGKMIYIDRKDVKLPDGSYFFVDLIGLSVVDNMDNSIVYGTITDVSQTGANDVYHIKMNGNTDDNDNRCVLMPAIKDVVIKTDIENGKMFIKPMRGLFKDED